MNKLSVGDCPCGRLLQMHWDRYMHGAYSGFHWQPGFIVDIEVTLTFTIAILALGLLHFSVGSG